MCRGGIEGYCHPNGVGNIPWLCYFLPFFSICFTDGLPPLPLILRTLSQHFFIDVLAFSLDTHVFGRSVSPKEEGRKEY